MCSGGNWNCPVGECYICNVSVLETLCLDITGIVVCEIISEDVRCWKRGFVLYCIVPGGLENFLSLFLLGFPFPRSQEQVFPPQRLWS
jgi:hypothetical protein